MPSTLAWLMFGGAAFAQTATGTLVPKRQSSAMTDASVAPNGTKQPGDQALESGRAMARCMAGNHPKETDALLAAVDMPAYDATYRRVRRDLANCLTMAEVYGDTNRIEARFDSNTLRSLLAEARLRRAGVVRLAPVAYDAHASGSEWIAGDPAARATLQTADCLVARQPDAVADVLQAPPASPAENATFTALMPHLAGCLDRNVRLSVRKVGLRLALASAYDRRARQSVSANGSH